MTERSAESLRRTNRVLVDARIERERQIVLLRYSAEHDDQLAHQGLTILAISKLGTSCRSDDPFVRRAGLVKAIALLIAEVERLDRAAERDG